MKKIKSLLCVFFMLLPVFCFSAPKSTTKQKQTKNEFYREDMDWSKIDTTNSGIDGSVLVKEENLINGSINSNLNIERYNNLLNEGYDLIDIKTMRAPFNKLFSDLEKGNVTYEKLNHDMKYVTPIRVISSIGKIEGTNKVNVYYIEATDPFHKGETHKFIGLDCEPIVTGKIYVAQWRIVEVTPRTAGTDIEYAENEYIKYIIDVGISETDVINKRRKR